MTPNDPTPDPRARAASIRRDALRDLRCTVLWHATLTAAHGTLAVMYLSIGHPAALVCAAVSVGVFAFGVGWVRDDARAYRARAWTAGTACPRRHYPIGKPRTHQLVEAPDDTP